MLLRRGLPLLLLGLLAVLHAPSTDGARILAAFTFPGKSHFMMSNVLIRELVKRGHEVTHITPFSLSKENLGRNYTEILIPPYDFWTQIITEFQVNNIFDLVRLSTTEFIKMMRLVGVSSSDFALSQPNVQKLINADPQEKQFDLLLSEQFYNEPFLALAYKFNIPIVTSSTFGYTNYLSQMVGIVTPWSYVPHLYLPITDHMNFMERFKNTLVSLYEDLFRKYIYMPEQDAVVRKHFSHLPVKIPTVSQMEKDVSLLLLNTYVPLISPRPTSFNMVHVGGMHIYPPKELPEDMQKFLDEAEHGVIYFSLGSNVRSADMPPEKVQMFLRIFTSLKQRVLWKFEDENLPKLPKNIMVKAWMPQNDILAHPNTRIFITHGGLFGTQEGVYYGVPMLGIPVYCDQALNMNKAVLGGYALSINYNSIEEGLLRKSVNDLLNNPKYRSNALAASRAFRDRPHDARETAMYWIEYIIRHQGAPFLQNAGKNQPWYQFFLIDVVAVIFAIILLIALVVYFSWRNFLRISNKKFKGD